MADEIVVRSDDVRVRSFAKRGRTPIVHVGNKRFGPSIILAESARGGMRRMVFKGALNERAFMRFLTRLIKDAGRKVLLNIDNLRVHHAKVLTP